MLHIEDLEDYDGIFALWNSTEQSRRAFNPVDDSREGVATTLVQKAEEALHAESLNASVPQGE